MVPRTQNQLLPAVIGKRQEVIYRLVARQIVITNDILHGQFQATELGSDLGAPPIAVQPVVRDDALQPRHRPANGVVQRAERQVLVNSCEVCGRSDSRGRGIHSQSRAGRQEHRPGKVWGTVCSQRLLERWPPDSAGGCRPPSIAPHPDAMCPTSRPCHSTMAAAQSTLWYRSHLDRRYCSVRISLRRRRLLGCPAAPRRIRPWRSAPRSLWGRAYHTEFASEERAYGCWDPRRKRQWQGGCHHAS